MSVNIRSIVVGHHRSRRRPSFLLLVLILMFLTSFTGYYLEIFAESSGLVWIPFHAAIVGMIAAGWIGFSRGGLVLGWASTYSALLGWHAEWALFEISRRPLSNRLEYFVRLDGLIVLAIQALVLGTIAFILGSLARWAWASLQRSR